MTAAATIAEAAVITRGWDTYRRVMEAEWPANGRKIAAAAFDLHDALELYGCIKDGTIHPGSEFPELEHEDEAYDKALRMAAEEAGGWADELDSLLPSQAAEAAAA